MLARGDTLAATIMIVFALILGAAMLLVASAKMEFRTHSEIKTQGEKDAYAAMLSASHHPSSATPVQSAN